MLYDSVMSLHISDGVHKLYVAVHACVTESFWVCGRQGGISSVFMCVCAVYTGYHCIALTRGNMRAFVCVCEQTLAINRGESLKILTVKVNIPDRVKSDFTRWCINNRSDTHLDANTLIHSDRQAHTHTNAHKHSYTKYLYLHLSTCAWKTETAALFM